MDINLSANTAQLPGLVLCPKIHISVEGRGTGKSFDIGFTMDKNIRFMPRSVTAMTGKTIGQLLTRTLPSALKLLDKMGYVKDVHYVVCKRPPNHFLESYEKISRFDNFISFINGTRFALLSQFNKESGRGANFDYEIMDEALTINIEQYNNEITPANRGNLEYFGQTGKFYCPWHHGAKYSTSMPTIATGKWILDYAEYYEKESGIKLMQVWNRIVALQCELLDITNPKQFTELWNEIERTRKKIKPFVSKDGVLFTIANAFDNIKMLGLNFIRQNRDKLPNLIFMTEIMNAFIDKVEDCFYSISEKKHVYYTHFDNAYIKELAIENNFDANILANENSTFDRDCHLALPLEIVPDWGSSINLFCVCQQRKYDFVEEAADKHEYLNFINEFFVKPDGGSKVLIEDLCYRFSQYYKHHSNRNLIYYRDKYGDHKNPNVINSMSFNQQAITYLTAQGWHVEERTHKGMEPPQSDKYLLWARILRENEDMLPRVRFNGNKCRFTLISMNNTRVIDKDVKFAKDKSSEKKSSGITPEEATHFSDAADKIVWTKYGENAGRDIIFVETRI
jgi:hypothetical protein